MSDEVKIHGRDFTAYRIGGAISALILGFLLIWQVWELFDDDSLTVPEVHWGAASGEGETDGVEIQSGIIASDVLRARTKLQDCICTPGWTARTPSEYRNSTHWCDPCTPGQFKDTHGDGECTGTCPTRSHSFPGAVGEEHPTRVQNPQRYGLVSGGLHG